MSQDKKVICVICGGDEWQRLGAVYSGTTVREGTSLQRTELEFSLGRCCYCGHVAGTRDYDADVFGAIYAIDNQQPVSWGETGNDDRLAPYVEMVEIFGGRALGDGAGLIIDVGCGNGPLLSALSERFDIPDSRLLGIDFNRMLPDRFPFLQADLNTGNLRAVVDAGAKNATIDVVASSHVIEHVLDPRRFLRQLKQLLGDSNGLLYLETPDFASLDSGAADVCNLLHPQHINYFTAESLASLLRSCGFVVERIETHVTGQIPRLRCLARAGDSQVPARLIRGALDTAAALRRTVAERLVASNEPATVWGCGGDLWRLIEENPAFATLLQSGVVRIADRAYAGAQLFGHEIISSADIKHRAGPVIIIPAYFGTRRGMLGYARSEGFGERLVDPYAQ
ncbi:class I SAM-dependent methyltransferase [Herbaspirillum sp. YR522]|uniref:class I SAM-dependent methyltransferase n=1 Tax=Herbaspirillum sp. YR522 TaxID=1144342 RepID=UPI00026FAA9B|nr:class I SAM-dependent methyltransferase [Herbaspirillum sp. YR522]EJN09803.1 methyltransferase family protein [Herbaspirillum sp. YR522]